MISLTANQNSYHLNYNPVNDKLEVSLFKENESNEEIIGALDPENFKEVTFFYPNVEDNNVLLDNTDTKVNSSGSINIPQTIKCLKIKEKRLLFAEKNPMANRILNVLSSIAIGLLIVPWVLGLFLSSGSGGGSGSPLEGYLNLTQRGWNWIKPTSRNHMRESINSDKEKLVQLIQKVDVLCTEIQRVSNERSFWRYKITNLRDKFNDRISPKNIQTIVKSSVGKDLNLS